MKANVGRWKRLECLLIFGTREVSQGNEAQLFCSGGRRREERKEEKENGSKEAIIMETQA